MAKRDHCKVGTRDHCVECGKIIELRARSDRFRDPVWEHLAPEDPNYPTRCYINKDETYFTRKVSNPRSFCWEMMETSWTMPHCTRPVTDQDRHMCGIHSNSARKAEKKNEEYTQRSEMNAYVREEVGKILGRMKEEYDLEGTMDYSSHSGHYTGKIIVDPVRLMELLENTDEEF